MGLIKNIMGKLWGNPPPSKYEVQIAETIGVLKDNDKLRILIMEQHMTISDLRTSMNEKDLSHKVEVQGLNDKIRDLEKRVNDLSEKNSVLMSLKDPSDNPIRTAIFSILRIRPHIRTSTLSGVLGISDRTVRNYRREFNGNPPIQNSRPDSGNNNQ